MSEEQLKAFLKAVKADPALQKSLNATADANDFVAIAELAGFSISADELKSAKIEISEAELEGVAGGCWSVFSCTMDCGPAWTRAVC